MLKVAIMLCSPQKYLFSIEIEISAIVLIYWQICQRSCCITSSLIEIFWRIPTKGHLFLFNHFIDMRTTVNLSISCRKNVFLLKFSNKNTFFSTWNGLTNGWSHVYKMINLVWTNFNRLLTQSQKHRIFFFVYFCVHFSAVFRGLPKVTIVLGQLFFGVSLR